MDYVDETEALFELLVTSDDLQFDAMYAGLAGRATEFVRLCEWELGQTNYTSDREAERKANAAVVLFRLHQPKTGLHSATEWVLHRLKTDLSAASDAKAKAPAGAEWFLTSEGQTMIRMAPATLRGMKPPVTATGSARRKESIRHNGVTQPTKTGFTRPECALVPTTCCSVVTDCQPKRSGSTPAEPEHIRPTVLATILNWSPNMPGLSKTQKICATRSGCFCRMTGDSSTCTEM